MRKIRMLFLLFVPMMLSAQISRKYQAARAGDVLIKQEIGWFEPGESGRNRVWDFSEMTTDGEEYVVEYKEATAYRDSIYVLGRDTFRYEDMRPGELMISLEHYTAYYYRIKNDRVYMIGFENPVNLMRYPDPLPVIAYPMSFGDKWSDSYTSEVIYSYTDTLYSSGTMTVEADAEGMLILPSGDTLRQVTRIKSIQTIDDNAAKRKASHGALSTVTESFRWFAEGYRYPIVETTRFLDNRQAKKQQVSGRAFLYLPEAHRMLAEDADNEQLLESRDDSWLRGRVAEAFDGHSSVGWSVTGTDWNCRFYPNPVVTDLVIDYELTSAASVGFTLHDAAGRLVESVARSEKNAGLHQTTLPCIRLASGNYILKIYVGDEQASQIVIKE